MDRDRPWCPRPGGAAHGPARAEARVGLSRAGRGGVPAVARAVAAAAGRARAGAIRLAGEPSGLLRHAGTSAVRAGLHAGTVGPDSAWRVVGVGAGGPARAPGPGRAGSADAARVVRGGLPRRQARGAPDSGDLPDARGPLRARDRVAARVSRPPGLVPGRGLLVLLDRALAADRERIRPERAAESAGGRRRRFVRSRRTRRPSQALGVQYVVVHADRLRARRSRHHRRRQGQPRCAAGGARSDRTTCSRSVRRPDCVGLHSIWAVFGPDALDARTRRISLRDAPREPKVRALEARCVLPA